MARPRRRRLPALPARPPRRGGHRRGDRRPALGGLGPGREPAADRAGRPARADHRALVLMRVVAALGGNALLRRGEPAEATQRRNVEVAAALAALAREHELVVTHGNGPQVGLLALQAEAYRRAALSARRPRRRVRGHDRLPAPAGPAQRAARAPGRRAAHPGPRRSAHDPAFAAPTKPIGPVYDEATATLAAQRGWTVQPDGEALAPRRPLRRSPTEIVELRTIALLVDAGGHRHLRGRRRRPGRRTTPAGSMASRR